MSNESGHRQPVIVSLSHRQGVISLAGGFIAMLAATAVTDSFGWTVALVLGGVAAATAAVFGLIVVTGQASHRWSLMLWPVAVCCAISALEVVASQASMLVVGLVTLSFLFIGLSQLPLHGLWLVLPASLVFLQVLDLPFELAAVRLPITALVWIVCAEVPARLILELRDKQTALELLATTDSLTGLLNRSRLGAQLGRVGSDGAVAMIDMDHFKQFNDRHGHLAGDVALMDFAAVLRDGVRPGDQVYRYGGEEFLLVLEEVSLDEACQVLDRIRATWAQNPSGLTFSAGLTCGGLAGLSRADELLYQAKAQGRDRVVFDSGSADAVVSAM